MIITVFDWDDTLMATTHVQTTGDTSYFNLLSESIRSCIDIAKKHGQVYIITNGQKEWFNLCLNFLPDCKDLLDEVIFISTVDNKFDYKTPLKEWKYKAFKRLIPFFSKRDKNNQIIAFGDAAHDRAAALHVKDILKGKVGYLNTFVKHIKLIESADFDSILKQQKIIRDIFYHLVDIKEDVDLSFQVEVVRSLEQGERINHLKNLLKEKVFIHNE